MRIALKLAILEADKTQREVAFACDIAESRLSEIVRGWADPNEHQRNAIAEALGRPVAELFGAQRPEERRCD